MGIVFSGSFSGSLRLLFLMMGTRGIIFQDGFESVMDINKQDLTPMTGAEVARYRGVTSSCVTRVVSKGGVEEDWQAQYGIL